MSCDPDEEWTECLEALGGMLPDNFFRESYTDTFADPLLVVLYADYLCDECLRASALHPLRDEGWARERAAAGLPDRTDDEVEALPRAEIVRALARMPGLDAAAGLEEVAP